MEEIIRKLQVVNYTLNQIEVHGQGNLDKLLGSMQALRDAIDQLQAARQEVSAQGEPPCTSTK